MDDTLEKFFQQRSHYVGEIDRLRDLVEGFIQKVRENGSLTPSELEEFRELRVVRSNLLREYQASEDSLVPYLLQHPRASTPP